MRSRLRVLRLARLPRRTIRLRLTVLCAALFLVSGAALVTTTYLTVSFTFPKASVQTHSYDVGPGPTPRQPLVPLRSPASLRAQKNQQRAADLHQLLVVSGAALAAMGLLSLLLGWLVAGRALHPLRTITAAARDLSSTDLHRRLALAGPDDELKELGDTFDGLLGRLERSFRSQRQFVANASHELRTPLALQRALLEAALTDPEPADGSLRAACERLLDLNTQQNRLIEALLTLATSERGVEHWHRFDLADIARQAIEARRPEAASLGLHVEVSLTPGLIRGDPDLVGRLVANLLDNALRYNVPDGWVAVSTETDAGGSTLRVSNTGQVVPADEISDLFQPFRRLGARTRHDDSHGLGLSIVSAITTAHHADLTVGHRPGGGLDITVRFPRQPIDG
jgi:signal transduction histidine kinase